MKYLYYQTIMQFKIPVSESGSMGRPQFVNSFTKPYKEKEFAAKKAPPKPKAVKKKQVVKTAQSELNDEEYM